MISCNKNLHGLGPSVSVQQHASVFSFFRKVGILTNLFQNTAVFGPNDLAFNEVAEDLQGAGETEIVATLGGHVVQTVYTAQDLIEFGCVILRTVVGSTIRVMYVPGEDAVMINDAKVILTDVQDDTSIFHGIDKVIDSGESFECPQTPEPTRAPSPPVVPPLAPSSAPCTGIFVALIAGVAALSL